MKGFTSSSVNPDAALDFAFQNLQEPNVPVFMKIVFNNDHKYYANHFQLNDKKYTVFKSENEILF